MHLVFNVKRNTNSSSTSLGIHLGINISCAMKFSGTQNMLLDSIGFHCMVKNINFCVLQKRNNWNDINMSKS